MSSRREERSRYVLVEDCSKSHRRIDLALFGEDSRGGIVKEINEIKEFMRRQEEYQKNNKELRKEKRETSLRWKLLTVGSVCGLVSFVIEYILNKV